MDVIQFDEPAFNVYMDEAVQWGIDALHQAIEGLRCTTAVHICYGYGIEANIRWKARPGEEWRQYERVFPALAASRIDQVSLECANARVPMQLMQLLAGKDVLVGVIDVANDDVETPRQWPPSSPRRCATYRRSLLFPCTNCGMAPMDRGIAVAKLRPLLPVRSWPAKPCDAAGRHVTSRQNRRRQPRPI